MVVLHVNDAFRVQFQFCRDKFVGKVKHNAGVSSVSKKKKKNTHTAELLSSDSAPV